MRHTFSCTLLYIYLRENTKDLREKEIQKYNYFTEMLIIIRPFQTLLYINYHKSISMKMYPYMCKYIYIYEYL